MSADVKLVYLIRAHRLPDQVARLVARLASPNAAFVVHLDPRVPSGPFHTALAARGLASEVHFTSRRFAYHFGFFGSVRASLAGMEDALERGPRFDHLVALSGQDYPIKPRDAIESLFARHIGCSFIDWQQVPRPDRSADVLLDHFLYRHYRTPFRYDRAPERRLTRIPNWWLPIVPKRTLPAGVTPYKGYAWFSLSREATEHVMRFTRENPWYVDYMKRTFLSDEKYFQTLLVNSPPPAGRMINDGLRYQAWVEGGFHPGLLRSAHLPELRRAKALFARKFDSSVDSEVLDLIDRELLGLAH
jgi:hypothetical protein